MANPEEPIEAELQAPEEASPARVAHVAEEEAVQQIREYATPILIGVTIALVVFFGFSAFRRAQAQTAQRASELFSQADTTEELEQVARDYPDSPVASMALLTLAAQQFHKGEYEAAMSVYQQFVDGYPEHLLIESAELGLAYCLEAMGNLEGSLNKYKTFQATFLNHYMQPMAVFGEARSLEQLGRYDDAREVYQNFIVTHPDSDWIVHAESAIKLLDMQIRAVNG